MQTEWGLPSTLLDYGLAGSVIFSQFVWIFMLIRKNGKLIDNVQKISEDCADRMERMVMALNVSLGKLNETMTEVKTHLIGLNGKNREAS